MASNKESSSKKPEWKIHNQYTTFHGFAFKNDYEYHIGEEHVLFISTLQIPQANQYGIDIKIANYPDFPTEKLEELGLISPRDPAFVIGETMGNPYPTYSGTTDTLGENPKNSIENTILLIDNLAPIPDAIKQEIAENLGLDTSRLRIYEDYQAQQVAEISYATRMMAQVNRQGELPALPDELVSYIGMMAATTDPKMHEEMNLTETEKMRASEAGFKTPASVEAAKKGTKREFLQTILDKNQPGANQSHQAKIEDEKAEVSKSDDSPHL